MPADLADDAGADTHDYVRNGTTSLFAAYDTGSGSVIAQHYRKHRHQEFIRFLKLIDGAVPDGLDLHLILDNYATHKTPEVSEVAAAECREVARPHRSA